MRILLASLLVIGSVSAADLTGKWVGSAETINPEGKTQKQAIYFQLRQSGDQLTGVIGSEGAQQFEISDGKVEGNTVTFVIKPEGAQPWSFRLTASGDVMQGESSAVEDGKTVKGRVDLKRE